MSDDAVARAFADILMHDPDVNRAIDAFVAAPADAHPQLLELLALGIRQALRVRTAAWN
jgi:hypothetical protein